jgi:hypothetical protein
MPIWLLLLLLSVLLLAAVVDDTMGRGQGRPVCKVRQAETEVTSRCTAVSSTLDQAICDSCNKATCLEMRRREDQRSRGYTAVSSKAKAKTKPQVMVIRKPRVAGVRQTAKWQLEGE